MTSRLALLHSRLARLRRTRTAVDLLSAGAGLLAAVLLALFAIFLLDWLFRLDLYQRLIVMALAGGGLLYFGRKYGREMTARRGDEIHAALWVQRQHEIDSDLVAAIQFERAAEGTPASQQLASAVVAYVADATPSIQVFQGFSTGLLGRRLTTFAGCAALAVVLAVAAPHHLRVFGQRLLLGSQAYPTRTQIERVSVGEAVVLERGAKGRMLVAAKASEAQPLRFAILCGGARPATAVVHVQSATASGPKSRVVLKPVAPSAAKSGDSAGLLTGELPRVHEDLRYWIVAGDAQTEVGLVRMIPLPTLAVEVKATPPAYAASAASDNTADTTADSVLEGSMLELTAACTNGKPLQSVTATLQSPAGEQRLEFVASDERRTRWHLAAGQSALAAIRSDLRYEIHAVDEDGLSPAVHLRGVIRVHPDNPPQAAGSVVHRLVLPAAQPVIGYRVGDDFGIARLQLLVDVERADQPPMVATPVGAMPVRVTAPTLRFDIPLPMAVATGAQLPLSGSYVLALSPLGLNKGDRLKLTLEATDYRGEDAAGTSAASDSLVLEVADESQVLSAIRQADERSEAQLNEIIRRQLGVGQEP